MTTLWKYAISYQKPGGNFPMDSQGTEQIGNEISELQRSLVEDLDYNQRRKDTEENVILSFITRPSIDTITINRIWTDKAIGDAFYTANDSSVFQRVRDKGWNVTWTVEEFNPDTVPPDIVLI